EPDRTGLVDGREGLRMADHLERHAVLLQVLGHDRHERPPAPNSTAQRSSTRTTADTKPMIRTRRRLGGGHPEAVETSTAPPSTSAAHVPRVPPPKSWRCEMLTSRSRGEDQFRP